jgi:hypothetical protein
MNRLSLQVFYLWRHVFWQRRHLYYGGQNLEILLAPLYRSSPFIGELRCQAIQTEHGPYIAERTQKAVYIVRCLWVGLSTQINQSNLLTVNEELDICDPSSCFCDALRETGHLGFLQKKKKTLLFYMPRIYFPALFADSLVMIYVKLLLRFFSLQF